MSRQLRPLLPLLLALGLVKPLSAAADAGTLLLGELNCTACHAVSERQAAWLSAKTAPRLAGLGARASAEWLQRYLAAPHATMPGTTMPDVLHGLTKAGRAEAAEALTHHLLSPGPTAFHRVFPDRAACARASPASGAFVSACSAMNTVPQPPSPIC